MAKFAVASISAAFRFGDWAMSLKGRPRIVSKGLFGATG